MRIMCPKQNQGQAEQVTENPRRRRAVRTSPSCPGGAKLGGEDPGGQPVALADRTLTCVECGGEFIFTAGEQEFFQTRGFGNEPKRCRSCRAVRRSEQRSGGMYQEGPREMYPINCAECGHDAMVPFRPRGDRPVYCSDCFSKMRTESSPGV